MINLLKHGIILKNPRSHIYDFGHENSEIVLAAQQFNFKKTQPTKAGHRFFGNPVGDWLMFSVVVLTWFFLFVFRLNMESVDFDSLYDKLMKLVHKRSHKICPIRRRHEVEGSWRIDTLCVEFQRRTMSQYPGYSVCQACQEYEAMTSLFSSNGANQALYVVKKIQKTIIVSLIQLQSRQLFLLMIALSLENCTFSKKAVPSDNPQDIVCYTTICYIPINQSTNIDY